MMMPALLSVLCGAAPGATTPDAAPVFPRYVLHQLVLPAQTVLAGNPNNDVHPATSFPRIGPRTIALAANGTVAAVVADAEHIDRARRIVVWRTDGRRAVVGLPSDGVMREAFHARAGDDDPILYAAFVRVVLAPDGTPFATVANSFSGAYNGLNKGIVRWGGAAWTSVRPAAATPPDLDVAAADAAPPRFGITGDFTSSFLTYDEVAHDPTYQRPSAIVYDGAAVRRLGTGTLTGLAGAYACGFIGEENGMVMPDNVNVPSQVPYALLWHAGATKRLGRGIAFGVNASGVAVGDNRVSAEGGELLATRAEYDRLKITHDHPPLGMPMRWDARGAHVLGREPGTAFAIAPDGTIVGTFARGGGFIARGGSGTIALDRRVRGRHAPVLGAYAINARGRILVLTGTADNTGLAYLDPTTPSSR